MNYRVCFIFLGIISQITNEYEEEILLRKKEQIKEKINFDDFNDKEK